MDKSTEWQARVHDDDYARWTKAGVRGGKTQATTEAMHGDDFAPVPVRRYCVRGLAYAGDKPDLYPFDVWVEGDWEPSQAKMVAAEKASGLGSEVCWTNDTEVFELVPVIDDNPTDETEGIDHKAMAELIEFAAGWDKACAKWKALVELEDAQVEGLLMNEGYDMGHTTGHRRGYRLGLESADLLHDSIIELDPSRQKLLDLFLTIEPGEYSWHETFRKLWESLGGMP